MTFEQTWSQPLENYQQTGSFVEPATPPAASPDAGSLVQLPCVNEDWLPLILGALDQLRNPSSWLDSLTDAQRYDVLGMADRLRQMVAMGLNVPCCNVELRLNNCVLEFSVDGGVTFTPVTDWAANFDSCVQGAIVPGVPLLPPGDTVDQRACNISEFLAEQLIIDAINMAIDDFNANKTLVSYITDILPVFAYAFPITTFGLEAFVFLYTFITSANIAEFEAAATDPVLLELVTCAIYGAIRPPGYVTASNKSAICSAIGAVTYAHPDVITAISGFCSRISLMQLQAMQNAGIYNSGIDCGGCSGSWCFNWNFALAPGAWAPVAPGQSLWVSGDGWRSEIISGSAVNHLEIFFSARTVTSVSVTYATDTISGGASREIDYFLSGSSVGNSGLFGAAEPPPGVNQVFTPNLSMDHIRILLDSSGPNHTTIYGVTLKGSGGNPFGLNNCPP